METSYKKRLVTRKRRKKDWWWRNKMIWWYVNVNEVMKWCYCTNSQWYNCNSQWWNVIKVLLHRYSVAFRRLRISSASNYSDGIYDGGMIPEHDRFLGTCGASSVSWDCIREECSLASWTDWEHDQTHPHFKNSLHPNPFCVKACHLMSSQTEKQNKWEAKQQTRAQLEKTLNAEAENEIAISCPRTLIGA